ncbi:Retrotransposon gag protein [Popillia japonica]|uniref:Retrotransposon gag protein n=1 Tax=Popillia japonica TaxID=7064 RepID=A0AAW1MID8_POPJA
MLGEESQIVQQRLEATEPVSGRKMILKPPIFDGLISWNNYLRQFEITAKRKMILKPPIFDGLISWNNYLRQFEITAKSNGWTEDLKASALANSLRGKALDILETMLPGEVNNYERLTNRLQSRFGQPPNMAEMYYTQLSNRKQGPAESLQEYHADVERLLRLANPDGSSKIEDAWPLHIFINGIREGETQQHDRLAQPKTLAALRWSVHRSMK